MARTFKLCRRGQSGPLRSSDAMDMPPRDNHWEDRQIVHETLGSEPVQTSLNPLPGHIPPNAELSHAVGGGPTNWAQEAYYTGGGKGWRRRRRFGRRRYRNRRWYSWPLLPYDRYAPWGYVAPINKVDVNTITDAAHAARAAEAAEDELDDLGDLMTNLLIVVFVLFLLVVIVGSLYFFQR